jgi:hypothetical protein
VVEVTLGGGLAEGVVVLRECGTEEWPLAERFGLDSGAEAGQKVGPRGAATQVAT